MEMNVYDYTGISSSSPEGNALDAWIGDAILEILSIPGVKKAVLWQVYKDRRLYDDDDREGDPVPRYIWEMLMPPFREK